MNARIPMSAAAQDHVAHVMGTVVGVQGFPGKLPVALVPEEAWRLRRASEYQGLELPVDSEGNSGKRAVLALLTTGPDHRCTAVVMTPARVICRVRFPTVALSHFRGTVLEGYMTDDTFSVTDVVAFRGRRVCGLGFAARMERAWQLVREVMQSASTPPAPTPVLKLDVATTRTLEGLTRLSAGTHLLVPEDRTFSPGRVQPDTFLVSFRGLCDML